MANFERKLNRILAEYAPVPNAPKRPVRPSSTSPMVPPVSDEAMIPIKIGYGTYLVFQQYWEGQGDPLYSVLSRRGSSVDWVVVFATPEEANRLEEVAQEIISAGTDEKDIYVARQFLKNA